MKDAMTDPPPLTAPPPRRKLSPLRREILWALLIKSLLLVVLWLGVVYWPREQHPRPPIAERWFSNLSSMEMSHER